MDEHYYAVIMAGGGGTRLWPLSRKATPKQMLQLFGDRTLFQIAISRLEGVFPPERVLVVTVADQAAKLQAQYPEIPRENYLIEPMPRGTASVVGLAAVALQHRDPEAVMAILTADHFIQNEAQFREVLRAARDAAQQDYLVTLGITPTYPATGYGYIQRGEQLGEYQGLPVYRVLRFKEKPDEDTAREMLAGGDHDWNSGMFIWQVSRILKEIDCQMPDLAGKLKQIAEAWGGREQEKVLAQLWPTLKSETVDYGIMEHASDVAVVPAAGLGWNDVGSWDSLFEVLPTDENGNIILGADTLALDTHHSLIFDRGAQRMVVTIGVSDLVIVDTGDALLICHKDQAQRVRQVVDQLKKDERGELL